MAHIQSILFLSCRYFKSCDSCTLYCPQLCLCSLVWIFSFQDISEGSSQVSTCALQQRSLEWEQGKHVSAAEAVSPGRNCSCSSALYLSEVDLVVTVTSWCLQQSSASLLFKWRLVLVVVVTSHFLPSDAPMGHLPGQAYFMVFFRAHSWTRIKFTSLDLPRSLQAYSATSFFQHSNYHDLVSCGWPTKVDYIFINFLVAEEIETKEWRT